MSMRSGLMKAAVGAVIESNNDGMLQQATSLAMLQVSEAVAENKVIMERIVAGNPKQLDFSSFEFSETSLLQLVKVITNAENLHSTLILQGCYLGDWFSTFIADALLQAVHLRTLDLSQCFIGAPGVKVLAKVLPDTELVNLNLWGNGIGDTGLRELAEALPKSRLNTLSLRSNRITEVGCKALARALPHTRITWLSLQNNLIKSMGARYLSSVLMSSKLRVLILEGTGLDEDAMKALFAVRFEDVAEGRRYQTESSWLHQAVREILPVYHINTLDLSFNCISTAGIEALRDNLDKTHLTYLNLTNCGLEDAACEALLAGLSMGAQPLDLQSLVLEGNAMASAKPLIRHLGHHHCKLISLNIARNLIEADDMDAVLDFLQKRYDDEDDDILKTPQEYMQFTQGVKKTGRSMEDFESMRRACQLRKLIVDGGSQVGYVHPGPCPAVLERDGLQTQINQLLRNLLKTEGAR
eukprot:TRINITY_DN20757_c0_g1_i1.p1 TRINITY_DN20757_c0_g1~~TRINITY_DN20757_c0_g1_i1.p1  ORF type:complete len:469 (+),score=140.39 TRINITY_DN20757_c0_g1_i1:99-1505(+)